MCFIDLIGCKAYDGYSCLLYNIIGLSERPQYKCFPGVQITDEMFDDVVDYEIDKLIVELEESILSLIFQMIKFGFKKKSLG